MARLTLSRVAETAGVSKGGLLHHFASKQDLVAALLDDLLSQTNDQLHDLAASNNRDNGAFAQAYLDYVRTSEHTSKTATGIFAAAALDDGDVTPAHTMFSAWQQRLLSSDGIDETTALLTRVIGDGLWLIDLFDLAPPTPAQRDALFELVEERLDQSQRG